MTSDDMTSHTPPTQEQTAGAQDPSEAVILDDIGFEPEMGRLMKKLRVKEGSRYADQLASLVDEAREIARPKAMYRLAFVDSREEKQVVIDGITFESRVLKVNLDGTHRVFPYTATCGTELYEWMQDQEDMMVQYYTDVIAESALRQATAFLKSHLDRRFGLGKTSTMSPGSLPDWPIQQQRPLFALLGDPEEAIGIRLSDSMLMIPSKSVSGIRFPVEKTFESCQLCPRDSCPSRQAPYDEDLYDKRYRAETEEASAAS